MATQKARKNSPFCAGLLVKNHYAVAARFPHNLSGQVPWQVRQAGVYDCRWGTDTGRVVVAGELPREAHIAPLHLFSAAPDLVAFCRSAYRQRSENTSLLLGQLFDKLHGEGIVMPYTMQDFQRQYVKEHLRQLTPQERREALESLPPEERRQVLQSLPPEERLEGLSPEQIRQYLDRLTGGDQPQPRKPPRKR
jgi:hypothetical protein